MNPNICALILTIWTYLLGQCWSLTCDEVYHNCNKKEGCKLDFVAMLRAKCIDLEQNFIPASCTNKNMCGYVIPYLLNKYQDFENCACKSGGDLNLCSVIEGLKRHPCLKKNPTTPFPTTTSTTRPLNHGPYFPNRDEEKLLKKSVRLLLHNLGLKREPSDFQIKQTSCLIRKYDCQRDHVCRTLWQKFARVCSLNTCENKSSECLNTYHQFAQYRTFDCTCEEYTEQNRMSECVQYQAAVIDNKCLALQNNRVVFEMLPLQAANTSKTMHLLKPFLQGKASCTAVYNSCLQDPRCLSHYIQLQQYCQWDYKLDQCSVSQYNCRNALNLFYQQPKPLVYQALVCHCSVEDTHCSKIKEVFKPTCALHEKKSEKLPNCLSLMQSCVQDMSCSDSYSIFTEVCIPSDGKCPFSSIQCLDAMRPMWGRILKEKCSCYEEETVQIAPIDRVKSIRMCKLIQNNLQMPSCWQPSTPPKPRVNLTKFGFDDPCQLKVRYNIPAHSAVRVYTPANYKENVCSMMCHCNITTNTRSCRNISCRVSDRTPADCVIHPEMGQSCQCDDGKVTCKPVVIPNTYQISPVLKLIYDSRDFEILRSHSSGVNMFSIGKALTAFIQSYPSGKNCEMTLQSHKENEAIFVVLVKSDKIVDYSQSKSIFRYSRLLRINHQRENECTDTLLFLRHLIHAGYPEVRHNAYLSIFKDAQLIYPPSKSESGAPSNQPHSGNLASSSSRHCRLFVWFTLLVLTLTHCLS